MEKFDNNQVFILKILIKKRKVANNDLVRLSGFSKNQLRAILTSLKDWLKPVSRFVELKSESIDELNDLLKPINWKNIRIKIFNFLEKHNENRPRPDRELDQFWATGHTAVKRMIRIAKNGDLFNKNIIVLGDDDLNSIILGLIGGAKRITVLEIDDRIVEYVRELNKQYNLGIEVIKFDLRDVLPVKLINNFDVVFTDPPYTPNGIASFINQAIKLLSQTNSSKIYFCYGNSDLARERELEIQKIINERGLLITEKRDKYCRYIGATSIGSRSSLYTLAVTPKTKVVNVLRERFYTHE